MHAVIQVERRGMTVTALTFSKEYLLPSHLALRRPRANEASGCRVQFRRRQQVEHVLHLGHVTHLNAIEDVHAFLGRMDFVAIKVRGALFELRKILDRSQTAL
jgi:hypothetical protein